MDTRRMTTYGGWHRKIERPVYKEGGDNRILSCTILSGGILNICYLVLRPDGTFIGADKTWHSERWLRRNATPWEHLGCRYWAYAIDLIPLFLLWKLL